MHESSKFTSTKSAQNWCAGKCGKLHDTLLPSLLSIITHPRSFAREPIASSQGRITEKKVACSSHHGKPCYVLGHGSPRHQSRSDRYDNISSRSLVQMTGFREIMVRYRSLPTRFQHWRGESGTRQAPEKLEFFCYAELPCTVCHFVRSCIGAGGGAACQVVDR